MNRIRIVVAATFAAFILTISTSQSQVTNLDDLNYWGSGPYRSALIVQWNDSKSPAALAWGFNWSANGTTVADMLTSLAASDPNFFIRIDSVTSFGLVLFGIGYQSTSTPFGVTGAQDTGGNPVTPSFPGGIDDLNSNPSATEAPASSASAAPVNSADRYKEGWLDNGYWELFHSGTSAFSIQPSYTLPTTWTSSWVGSSVTLVDQGWVVFSMSNPDYSSNPPTTSVVAAIPEPGILSLFCVALAVVGMVSRRHARPA